MVLEVTWLDSAGLICIWVASLVPMHVGHFKRRRAVMRARDGEEPAFLVLLSDRDPRFLQFPFSAYCGILTTSGGRIVVTFEHQFLPLIRRVEFSARKADCVVTVSGDRITLSKRSDSRSLTVEPQRLSWTPLAFVGQFRMSNEQALEVGTKLRGCLPT